MRKGKKRHVKIPKDSSAGHGMIRDREVSLAPHGHQISILELVMTTCAIHGPR